MPLHAFQQFSPAVQLYWVLRHGTYLANRWDGKRGINLYHCDGDGRGSFVEVGVDDERGQAVVLGSFSNSAPLEAYALTMNLPEV